MPLRVQVGTRCTVSLLEPGGLCISRRCDCSIGYRLLKLQGSGCKPEPARLVGAVSRRRLRVQTTHMHPFANRSWLLPKTLKFLYIELNAFGDYYLFNT